jgi:putative transposase
MRSSHLTPVYLALSRHDTARCDPYRDLFHCALGEEPLADRRMALNQDQPVGNSRFYAQIEAMTGQRRELRKRGRPRKTKEKEPIQDTEQQKLPI